MDTFSASISACLRPGLLPETEGIVKRAQSLQKKMEAKLKETINKRLKEAKLKRKVVVDRDTCMCWHAFTKNTLIVPADSV